jgi:O-antigen ligase
MRTWVAPLLLLAAIAIPIEHKYDKHFRFFSLKLIPEGLQLPAWFDVKIYQYPSDIILLLVAGLLLVSGTVSARRLVTGGNAWLLFFIALCAVISVAASSLWNYPIPYLRIHPLVTGFLCYACTRALPSDEVTRITRWILTAWIGMGCFQAAVGITQFFTQAPVGLHFLEEPKFAPGRFASIPTADGTKWLLERWLGAIGGPTGLIRATGTLPHPNLLGGYLALTILTTLHEMGKRRGRISWVLCGALVLQSVGLMVSFSRSAIFGLLVGAGAYFFLMAKGRVGLPWRRLGLVLAAALLLTGTLFKDQIVQRGGLINYSPAARQSDQTRLVYQKFALKMIADRPWTGVGFSQFTYQLPGYLPEGSDPKNFPSGVHNIFLFLAAETGLPALAAFLLFLARIVRDGYRALTSLAHQQRPNIALLLALLAVLLFIGLCDFYPILFQQGRLLLFFVAGLLAAHSQSSLHDVSRSQEVGLAGIRPNLS